jgi:hypothetical protein
MPLRTFFFSVVTVAMVAQVNRIPSELLYTTTCPESREYHTYQGQKESLSIISRINIKMHVIGDFHQK